MQRLVRSRQGPTRFAFAAPRLAPLFLLSFLIASCDSRSIEVSGPPKKIWEEFSGERALTHVQAMVDFGPRPPGSEAIEKTRKYLTKQLELAGWKVSRQAFTESTPEGKIEFVNLIATFGEKDNTQSFLVCSHYDTKIFKTVTFVGANDGGSSTGLLVELARVLSLRPEIARKVALLFFDGEEAFETYSDTDGFYGSRHFAKQLIAEGKVKQFRGGVVLDMVGDRALTITLPPDSPPEMANDIFESAEALNLRNYFTYSDRSISDDHTLLNAAGIPAIDLIDFDYPAWHTAEDTMDKISAESLQKVGSLVGYYLAEVALKKPE